MFSLSTLNVIYEEIVSNEEMCVFFNSDEHLSVTYSFLWPTLTLSSSPSPKGTFVHVLQYASYFNV